MSVRMMSEVWRLQLDTPAKMVLLKLADHANDDGGNTYPSVERIAEETGMHERSVQRALSRLRNLGLITVTHPATRYAPTTYAIHPSRGVMLSRYGGDRLSPLQPPAGVTDDTPQGWRSAVSGVTSGPSRGGTPPPKPSVNHQRTTKRTVTSPPNPPLSRGAPAERAKNGSRRQRDMQALKEQRASVPIEQQLEAARARLLPAVRRTG